MFWLIFLLALLSINVLWIFIGDVEIRDVDELFIERLSCKDEDMNAVGRAVCTVCHFCLNPVSLIVAIVRLSYLLFHWHPHKHQDKCEVCKHCENIICWRDK